MLSITILGRVSKGAKLTKAGNSDVCNFSVSAGLGDDAQIVGCSLWGKRAQALAEHLVQGVPVTVSGALSLETHEGHSYMSVRSVQDIAILDTVENVKANRKRYRIKCKAQQQQQTKQRAIGSGSGVVDGRPWGLVGSGRQE
ncbi:single-stranded DNA-binding protein [Ruegeria sp. HKCCA5491]|uniref:single-stranded DNA-binding protein n=1 Tax=Ruegeria sp. HKCCA5491 TaxID=2682986 RepID=UPI001489E87B|nr:single-stranded DNA-binding protein [Ruegeria sp. HKCCA5491]